MICSEFLDKLVTVLKHDSPDSVSWFSSILNVFPADPSGRTVCGRLLAGIAGSSPLGVVYICVLWVLCVVRERSLGLADHSSRGVLPSVVCLSVIVKPWQWGGPRPLLRPLKNVSPFQVYNAFIFCRTLSYGEQLIQINVKFFISVAPPFEKWTYFYFTTNISGINVWLLLKYSCSDKWYIFWFWRNCNFVL
jgi:hypothetical protein